jgi:hypothetical protein
MKKNRLTPIVRTGLLGMMLSVLAPVSRATLVAPPDFAELVREADCVVRAVVKSITPEEKAAPGHAPMIYSKVELDVKQVIAGTPANPLILEVLGGKLGDREMYIAGAPRFTVGEESIFFIQGNGVQIFPLVRMMHGLYPILKDKSTGKEYVARSNGQPMDSTSEISQPMRAAGPTPTEQQQAKARAMTPEEFINQIHLTAQKAKPSAH